MKTVLKTLSSSNARAKSLSMRLTKLTGKSSERVHPKHLVHSKSHYWYLDSVQPSDVVLDVGCGYGMHSLAIAEQANQVHGIDFNTDHLRQASLLAKERGIKNVSFSQVNLEEKNSIPNHIYDVIFMHDVIEHIHRRVDLLKEAHTQLEQNGLLIITFPNSETKWKKRLRKAHLDSRADPDHKKEYTYQEMEEELSQGGFAIQQTSPITYDSLFAGWIDVVGGISLEAYTFLHDRLDSKAQKYPDESSGWRVIAKKL